VLEPSLPRQKEPIFIIRPFIHSDSCGGYWLILALKITPIACDTAPLLAIGLLGRIVTPRHVVNLDAAFRTSLFHTDRIQVDNIVLAAVCVGDGHSVGARGGRNDGIRHFDSK